MFSKKTCVFLKIAQFFSSRVDDLCVNLYPSFFFVGDWEVLDSFLNVCSTIVRHRLEQIRVEHLITFATETVKSSNSFIRASATELLVELLCYDNKSKKLFDIEQFTWNVFKFETEAIVRRTCAKMLIKFDGKGDSSKIRTMMLQALGDLDWEVKEQVVFLMSWHF